LFVGLLMSLFGSSYPTGFVFASMAIGSAFGMLFGVISYALTGGRRDFTSTSQIVASEYEVLCMPEHAQTAIELLHRLAGGTGRPSDPKGAASMGGAVTGPMGTRQPGWPPSVPSGTPYLPPPTGPPSPGPGPGEPGGPPAPAGWSGSEGDTAAEPPAPEVPVTGPTYGEMIEKKRREERERADREVAERIARERADRPGEGS
jgi:hypothetical protein